MHHQAIFALIALSATTSHACPGHIRRSANETTTSSTLEVQTRIKPAVPTSNTAITNVRVWDGYSLTAPKTLHVSGESIVDAQAVSTLDRVINVRNGIMLPGFFDAHAHPGSVDDLETLSSYGVTTVLAQSCADYAFCASMRDQTGLTSYFTAGQPAMGPNSSHANNAHAQLSSLIWEPSQAPSFVHDVFSNGSDWFKVVSELHGPDLATQTALVLQAYAQGKKSPPTPPTCNPTFSPSSPKPTARGISRSTAS